MCIIAVKPAGSKLPTDQTLRDMFRHNPHGAGFMYARNGLVEIRKGFMTYDAFAAALKNTLSVIGEDAPLVMHFRITTHGGTTPGNTHPFPVTTDIADMHRTSTHAKLGVAHNGIIQITPRSADVSDTMEFIADVLAPVARKNPRFYETKRIVNGIRDSINGSRMAIMTGDGNIVRIGSWIESGGCYYSNDSFKPLDTRFIWTPVTHTPAPARESDKLPWERNSRVYTQLTVLDPDDAVELNGETLSGEWFGIDRSRRVWMIDPDDATAISTDAHVLTDARYDRSRAIYFEIA